MKTVILTLLISITLFVVVQAQPTPLGKNPIIPQNPITPPIPQDTILKIELTLNEMRALVGAIDQNIDSKKASKEIIEFLSKKAQMVQPADKPKTP